MKKRQRALLIATTVVSIAALTACGSGGGGSKTATADFTAKPTGTLDAWGFENADDVGQARLDYAASQLKGVDVKLNATAFDAQKFTAATASGKVPDVVQMSSQYVGTYAAKGLIVPLDE
jgi:multiple sugar transport system substrate-binding protein